LVGSDSVVVKDFSVSSSLCALKIFVSAIELVSVDDFCVGNDSVLSTIYESAVV
jgi:hypothetical protein